MMNLKDKFDLIKEVGEEIITEKELKDVLKDKKNPSAYDGFEPSGTSVHIAQGLLRAININKMTKAGVNFQMLVADWHAWANNKMGGDLDLIQKVGGYLIEVWRACEMDLDNVKFNWANDFIQDPEYWKIVMDIARNNTVNRITRCSQIMGRSEKDTLQASQIIYPCMQCADIFYQKCDITQLGMDQRKVNVLAREVGPKIGFWKPIVVSHHMLMGLSEPPKTKDPVKRATQMKMSKSNPDNAIFMDDSEKEIDEKIKKAYCPEKVVKENPILEYCKYLIFEYFDEVEIERPKKYGGDLEFKNYEELEKSYKKGNIHPLDLKKSVSFYLNKMLEPYRKKLKRNKKAQRLSEEIKEAVK